MQITCLIVEDHRDLRDLMRQWLQLVFPAVEFIGLETGEEALERIQTSQPRAILMDVSLPGMSGIEATRQIKSRYPDVFVLIHTINDDLAFRNDASQAGADGYLLKSKSPTAVITSLSEVFSNSRLIVNTATDGITG